MLAGPQGLQEKPPNVIAVEESVVSSRRPSFTSLEGAHLIRMGSKSSVGSQSRLQQYSPFTTSVLAPLPTKRTLRLPLDVQHKARELVQELQALKGQTGPSVELCVTTACGVLQHLCAVNDLEELAVTAASYASERRISAASVSSPAVGIVSSPCLHSQKVDENPQEDEENNAASSQAESGENQADRNTSIRAVFEEPASDFTPPLPQTHPSWIADVGSRRGSFQLQAESDRFKDGEEITTSNNKCYLHPESPFRLGWDFCSMLLILLLTILIPLEVCFFFDGELPLFLVIFQNLIDVFFILDIILNFFTAYHEGHGISGRLVTHFRGIAKHYAKGWLWIDIGASLPWLEIIKLIGLESLNSQGGEAVGMLKVLRYAKAARMMKVLRVLKLGGLMQVVEEKMVAAQSMTVAFQLLKMTVVMMVLSHNVACGWYAVAVFSEGSEAGKPQTWLQAENLDAASGASGWEQYVASFYFAITTGTTVGYGDIHPNNTLERAITTFVLILSVGYIGQFLGRVSQMVSSLRSLEAQMSQAKRDALLFMKKRGVQKDLQFRVLRYIEHVYETDAITALDSKIMELLSDSLQNQLALAITGSVLKQFPLFEACEENFLTVICQVCRTQRAGVGDTVVAEEQVAHEMFWVVRGEAAVFRRRVQIGCLKAGDWFSELALFCPGTVRKATVRCETNCEFLVLHHDHFQRKVELFPNVRRECDTVAAELRRGNTRALKVSCPNCGASSHFGRECPRLSR